MTSLETTTPRVERAAGRTPGTTSPANTVTAHMLQLSRRQAQVMQRAPPPRTPPSIPLPTPRPKTRGRPAEVSEFSHKAMRRPRSLLRHFKEPLRRSADSLRDISTAPSPFTLSLMGSLQVCPINLPLSRQGSLPSLFSDFSLSQENLASILKQHTDLSLLQEPGLQSIDEGGDAPPLERMVSFCHPAPLAPLPPAPSKPVTAPAVTQSNSQRLDSVRQSRQMPSLQSSRSVTSIPGSRNVLLSGRSQLNSRSGVDGVPSGKNLARMGRPIAQVAYIPDPEEEAFAAQIQREAAAAVDIQRIFRGYVARNVYRKLLRDERKKMEDKQRAAMEIQRAYRHHVNRKRVIEKRPYNPEIMEWANNYRLNLATRQQERRIKEQLRAEELSDNYYMAHSKLSVIGPHVNIYEIYHPAKTGPTKKELNYAATTIQRHVRGWLVRRRFDKLHRKAAWYGSTFPKMLKDYKTLLVRIQKQHGVEHPQTPFTTKDMNDYIDTRRRYETVFEKKAFGGELELGDLDSYFKECDLYPSQAEITKAMQVTFKDQSLARQGRGLKRNEILDMVFFIYTPKATGLENTRQSTWLNPIIDGVEARRLLGSEFVEEAPLEVCAQLVIGTIRERHEKERAVIKARKEQEAAELRTRLGLPHPKDDDEEDEKEERRRQKKLRRVTLTEPVVKDLHQPKAEKKSKELKVVV